MVVLGIDTTTRGGGLALVDGPDGRAEAGAADRTHGERLPGEALALLASAGRTLADVDLFAVVAGPGSFTGLRVGMATAQGLALTAGKQVVPVPTFEAVAMAWVHEAPETPAVVVCLDGQRGDVFYAAYDPHHRSRQRGPTVVLAPEVGTPAEAARVIGARIGLDPYVLIGSGAVRYASVFRETLRPSALGEPRRLPAHAAAIIASEQAGRAVEPHTLQPIYVRRPDAVLARDRVRSNEAEKTADGPLTSFPISEVRTDAEVSMVERLQRESFPQAWGEEALRWDLEKSDVSRLYLMRTEAGDAVGYCACWLLADELHINSLAVEDRFRRQGLATRLMATVTQEAVSRGARSATLEVRESNVAARALYEGLGFAIEGVRRDYYQQPREDALILWCRQLRVR